MTVTRRKLRAALMTVAFTAASLVPVFALPGSAEAMQGCRGKYRLMGDPWSETSYFTVPQRVGPYTFPRVVDIRVHATLGHWHCPQGRRNDRVKAVWIDWCWFQFGENRTRPDHTWFTGVTFNANIYDDSGANVNPAPFKVSDDNTRQNCATQNIAADKEAWMALPNEPRWKAGATVNLMNPLPDESFPFETRSGGTVNHIYPSRNVALSDWYRGTK